MYFIILLRMYVHKYVVIKQSKRIFFKTFALQQLYVQFTLLFRGHFVFKPTAKEDFRERTFFRGFLCKRTFFRGFFRERIFFRGFIPRKNTRSIIYKKRLIRNTSQVHFRNKDRSLKQTSQIKNLRNATI